MPRHDALQFEKDRGVTEVSVRREVAHATVLLETRNLGSGRLALLQMLANENVPVFLVKLLPDGLSFALRDEAIETGATLLKNAGVDHTLRRDLALVSTYAGAMRDLSGVMAAIYETLVGEKIRIRQTGDAYNAVHCLVAGADAERGAVALRTRFELTAGEAA
jgi:aspartokinase